MAALPKDYNSRDVLSGSLVKNLLRLSIPIAAGTVLGAMYNLVDAFWLGKYSKEALGAPGVTMPFVFIVISLGMGFGTAGTALVAQYTGAGRPRDADHVAGQNLLLLTALAIVLAIPMVVFGDHILAVFQVPADMAPDAIAYFEIVMAGIPFVAFTIAYGAILRALGDTITVVVIGILSNILNAAIDPLFIFGWGSFPRMGAGGAAIATVISQIAACVACMVLIRKHRAGLVLAADDLRPDWQVLRQTLSIGTPAAIGNASNSIGFSVFQILVNWLGTTVVGAFTIGFRIINFVNVPGQALAMAASPIVGQALGAGRPELARRAIKVSIAIVTVSMLPAVALLMWQGQLVARAFAFDKEVVAEAGRFFLIVPASSYLFGVIMVLTAAFTGSGHTRPTMFLAILRLWVVRVPVGFLLAFTFGMGSVGIYWGMVAGNVVSAVAAIFLVRGYKWQTAIIPTAKGGVEQASGVPAVEAVADESPSA